MHILEKKQDEFSHRLANDMAVLISMYRERLPDLEWHSIQKALTIVQAGLEVAQIGEKAKNSGMGMDSDLIR
ncbi:MAG: hypothetical protein V3U53_09775 [bacterium]